MGQFVISNFSGGLADSIYAGIQGSFSKGSKGIDIHTEPGILKSQYKLAKDSGTTVVDQILWSFVGTDGHTYYFGDAGKCYKRTSAGVWSAPGDVSARVCGACEYNDYIYVATSNKLKRVAKGGGYDLSALADWQTWTGAEVDTSWHPMFVAPDGTLYIGAGQYISSVNAAGSWNNQALDLAANWAVRCLSWYGQMILIGASYSASVFNLSGIFRWDGISDSFFDPCLINSPSINAMISDGNLVVFQAGNDGRIYQYLGGTQKAEVKQVPGTYTTSAIMDCYPGAIAFLGNNILFGISNSTGNPCDEGVYSWGAKNKNYPRVLNLDYIISQDKTASISVGNILPAGTDLFVGWKDGTTYGVDKLDYSNCYATTTYNSVVLGQGYPKLRFNRFTINFEPLAASTGITLKYKADRGTSWTSLVDVQAGAYSTTNGTSVTFDQSIEAGFLELQIILTVSGTSTPKIKNLIAEYEVMTR